MKATEITGYFTIFLGEDRKSYFNLKAGNHEIILQSEGYESKANALNGIMSVQENCQIDKHYKRKVEVDGKPYFTLIAGNGEPIGKGEGYSSEAMMEKGIESVKRNGTSTTVKDETHHGNDMVTISIKGNEFSVHRGSHLVSELKEIGHVPSGHNLVQIEGNRLTTLSDDARVTIKGGEKFDSTPKTGSNS